MVEKNFFNYILFTAKQKCYLIFDKAPCHIDKEIINFLNEIKQSIL